MGPGLWGDNKWVSTDGSAMGRYGAALWGSYGAGCGARLWGGAIGKGYGAALWGSYGVVVRGRAMGRGYGATLWGGAMGQLWGTVIPPHHGGVASLPAPPAMGQPHTWGAEQEEGAPLPHPTDCWGGGRARGVENGID